eukprot:g4121.t1
MDEILMRDPVALKQSEERFNRQQEALERKQMSESKRLVAEPAMPNDIGESTAKLRGNWRVQFEDTYGRTGFGAKERYRSGFPSPSKELFEEAMAMKRKQGEKKEKLELPLPARLSAYLRKLEGFKEVDIRHVVAELVSFAFRNTLIDKSPDEIYEAYMREHHNILFLKEEEGTLERKKKENEEEKKTPNTNLKSEVSVRKMGEKKLQFSARVAKETKRLYGNTSDAHRSALRDYILLLNSTAMSCLSLGEINETASLLKKAQFFTKLERDEAEPFDFVNLRTLTFNNIACYYRQLGKLKIALRYLRRAEAAACSNSSSNSDDSSKSKQFEYIGLTYLNLCAVLSQLNNHKEALYYANKAVQATKKYTAYLCFSQEKNNETNNMEKKNSNSNVKMDRLEYKKLLRRKQKRYHERIHAKMNVKTVENEKNPTIQKPKIEIKIKKKIPKKKFHWGQNNTKEEHSWNETLAKQVACSTNGIKFIESISTVAIALYNKAVELDYNDQLGSSVACHGEALLWQRRSVNCANALQENENKKKSVPESDGKDKLSDMMNNRLDSFLDAYQDASQRKERKEELASKVPVVLSRAEVKKLQLKRNELLRKKINAKASIKAKKMKVERMKQREIDRRSKGPTRFRSVDMLPSGSSLAENIARGSVSVESRFLNFKTKKTEFSKGEERKKVKKKSAPSWQGREGEKMKKKRNKKKQEREQQKFENSVTTFSKTKTDRNQTGKEAQCSEKEEVDSLWEKENFNSKSDDSKTISDDDDDTTLSSSYGMQSHNIEKEKDEDDVPPKRNLIKHIIRTLFGFGSKPNSSFKKRKMENEEENSFASEKYVKEKKTLKKENPQNFQILQRTGEKYKTTIAQSKSKVEKCSYQSYRSLLTRKQKRYQNQIKIRNQSSLYIQDKLSPRTEKWLTVTNFTTLRDAFIREKMDMNAILLLKMELAHAEKAEQERASGGRFELNSLDRTLRDTFQLRRLGERLRFKSALRRTNMNGEAEVERKRWELTSTYQARGSSNNLKLSNEFQVPLEKQKKLSRRRKSENLKSSGKGDGRLKKSTRTKNVQNKLQNETKTVHRKLKSKKTKSQKKIKKVETKKKKKSAARQTKEDVSSIVLQNFWRGLRAKRRVSRLRKRNLVRLAEKEKTSAIKVQKIARGKKTRREMHRNVQQKHEHNAAIKVQKIARGKKTRREMHRNVQQKHEHNAAIKVQKIARGKKTRREMHRNVQQKHEHNAAIKVQKIARGKKTRREMHRNVQQKHEHNAAIKVQKIARGKKTRREMHRNVQQKHEHNAAIKVQKIARGKKTRREMHRNVQQKHKSLKQTSADEKVDEFFTKVKDSLVEEFETKLPVQSNDEKIATTDEESLVTYEIAESFASNLVDHLLETSSIGNTQNSPRLQCGMNVSAFWPPDDWLEAKILELDCVSPYDGSKTVKIEWASDSSVSFMPYDWIRSLNSDEFEDDDGSSSDEIVN